MPDESHLYQLESDSDDPDEDECETCGGTGFAPQGEAEGNSVTYSSKLLVPCPDCYEG